MREILPATGTAPRLEERGKFRGWNLGLLLTAVLIAMTVLAFWRVLTAGFIDLDDPVYVTGNAHVLGGLTAGNMLWAWGVHAGYWIPLTWLSLMLDAQVYGVHAWGYHLTNLMLQCANVALLFAFLRRGTGSVERSFLIAAVFAVHPIYVESVVWVTERKDVLSVFLGLLSLMCYVNYAQADGGAADRARRWRQYGLSLLFFALGLLAKPLLVTFPLLLLLLDYWPLRRWTGLANGEGGAGLRSLLLEKAPYAALAAAECVVTVLAQRVGGALGEMGHTDLGERLANAVVSYGRYLVSFLWPMHLAVYYPYPKQWPGIEIVAALVVVAGITGWAVGSYRKAPWFTVGWLWFLIAMLPMIGLVQAGGQSMADRFMYLPSIGLLMIVAWALPAAGGMARPLRRGYVGAGVVAAVALAVATNIQIGYWRDSMALYQHALDVTQDNDRMNYDLGSLLAAKGDLDAALSHYQEAVRISPDRAYPQAGLGAVLLAKGQVAAALGHLQRAVDLDPTISEAQYNLGIALLVTKQPEKALEHLLEACRLDPGNEVYQRNVQRILRSPNPAASQPAGAQP